MYEIRVLALKPGALAADDWIPNNTRKQTGAKWEAPMRFRKAVCGVAVVIAVAGSSWISSTPAGATNDPGAEADFVGRTNALRAKLGLPGLSSNGTLVAKAQQWAEYMASVGAISHSNLADGAPGEWTRLGENVGRGPSVDAIHKALVASPEHYQNLTDPGFRYVGVGVVNANGTFYVSEVFMESASQPAPSTSAPAAATPSPGEPRSAHYAPAAVPVPPPPPPPIPLTQFPPEPSTRPTVVVLKWGHRWVYVQGPYRIS